MALRLFNGGSLRQLFSVAKGAAIVRAPQHSNHFIISSRYVYSTQAAKHDWKGSVWQWACRWGITSLCGLVGCITGCAVQYHMSTSRAHASKRMVKNEANFIADVVEEALPSVVAIEVGQTGCSGFIVSPDGLILTNAHPFPRGERAKAKVTLWDGRVLVGNVVAVDVQQDLAVIKIDEQKLPCMKLGDSSTLRAGEWVIAIGSPMGLKHTVTAGVISTKSRPGHELRRERTSREFVQTDAAITYGNSGGPLVNLDAEAIGINSLKMAPGISFAVPIDTAKEFLQAVEDERAGKIANANKTYLGVKMVTLSPDIIHPLESRMGTKGMIKLTEGVLLFQVEQDSPAQRSGMRRGDIIVSINDKPVKSVDDVYDATNSGKSVFKCKIMRAGRPFDLEIIARH